MVQLGRKADIARRLAPAPPGATGNAVPARHGRERHVDAMSAGEFYWIPRSFEFDVVGARGYPFGRWTDRPARGMLAPSLPPE
jgi:hypothetical protein